MRKKLPNFFIVGGFFMFGVRFENFFVGLVVAILLLAASTFAIWYKLPNESKDGPQGEEGRKGAVATYFWYLMATAFIFIFSFSLLLTLASQNPDLDNGILWFLTFISMIFVGVLLLNALFIEFRKSHQRIVIAGLAFFIFTMLSGWDFIPKQVMAFYQLGNVTNASLVLDKTGCSIARQHSITPDSTAVEICSLDSTTIQSRIGTPFLIEAKDSTGNPLSFTIPEEHVLSWSSQQRDE